uniref:RanBP2-type domain-containing protein n=1 Tax=Panagrolaimus davidi TaxID=227884 RepID=A0A914QI35_9BILA
MPISFDKKLELLKILPHFNAHPHQNFEKFLDELEEKSNVFGIKDSEKLELLPALLHGPASGKMKYLQQPKSSKSTKQWQDACEQLIIIMEKVKIAETSKIVMQQIRQDDQTVMEYANKMEKLADDTNKFGEQTDVMGQEELVKQFIRGLQHNIKKVIRRKKYSTFLEVVKAASDEEQQQTTNKTTAAFDQMSLESGQQRQMFQQRRGGFGNRDGGQQPRGDDWNCSCGYKNFAFRRVCNSCKYRCGDGNGPNRGNFNRGGGNYGNCGNFKRDCGNLAWKTKIY